MVAVVGDTSSPLPLKVTACTGDVVAYCADPQATVDQKLICTVIADITGIPVAEVEEEGQRKLIGVGRLVADVDHETAEYAVIVVDRWHGHGLGGLLTDYCLEVAAHWGVKSIVAETSRDNSRMLATFRNRGFELDHRKEEDVVLARKELQ